MHSHVEIERGSTLEDYRLRYKAQWFNSEFLLRER